MHRLGKLIPSNPGLILIFGTISLQERHWILIDVALARTDDADMMIPGIFTNFDILSD